MKFQVKFQRSSMSQSSIDLLFVLRLLNIWKEKKIITFKIWIQTSSLRLWSSYLSVLIVPVYSIHNEPSLVQKWFCFQRLLIHLNKFSKTVIHLMIITNNYFQRLKYKITLIPGTKPHTIEHFLTSKWLEFSFT